MIYLARKEQPKLVIGVFGNGKKFYFEYFYSHRRFGLFLSLNGTYLVAFAGGFFVWNGLWVPPNRIWVTRIIIWLMTATLCNQEMLFCKIFC